MDLQPKQVIFQKLYIVTGFPIIIFKPETQLNEFYIIWTSEFVTVADAKERQNVLVYLILRKP